MDSNRISRQEAADLLRVSTCTVANFVKKGLLPEPMKVGRRDWYLREDIAKVAKDGTRKLAA